MNFVGPVTAQGHCPWSGTPILPEKDRNVSWRDINSVERGHGKERLSYGEMNTRFSPYFCRPQICVSEWSLLWSLLLIFRIQGQNHRNILDTSSVNQWGANATASCRWTEHLTNAEDSACFPHSHFSFWNQCPLFWLEEGDLTGMHLLPFFWPKTK